MLVGNAKNLVNIYETAKSGKFAHAYLYSGPVSIGKTSFATQFAKTILCESKDSPCGECEQCKLFDSGNHPDFLLYDGQDTLGVDEVRELIKFLDLKPYQANHKVAVISHAEKMTVQAANSFLKTLEEPADKTVIILTTENPANLLPTVISRVQLVNFSTPSEKDYLPLFGEKNEAELSSLYNFSSGRIGLAVRMESEPDFFKKLKELSDTFSETVSAGSITERMKFAEKLAKEKEDLALIMDVLESYSRNNLLKGGQALNNLEILDKLARTKELLRKNVNTQLSLESLLLTGAKR